MHETSSTNDDAQPGADRMVFVLTEQTSGAILVSTEVDISESLMHTASHQLDRYIESAIRTLEPGEEREYVVFFKRKGGRPMYFPVKLVNKPLAWEKSVIGYRGRGATGTFPYRVSSGTPEYAKKGTIPAVPAHEPSWMPDDGIDDEAITSAMRQLHPILEAAISAECSQPSQTALLNSLEALMRSTGASGLSPRADCLLDSTSEGLAMLMFDVAIALWLRSAHASDLPDNIEADHRRRLNDDSDHKQRVLEGIAMYRRGF